MHYFLLKKKKVTNDTKLGTLQAGFPGMWWGVKWSPATVMFFA